MGNGLMQGRFSLLSQSLTIVGSILLAFVIDATWNDWIDEKDTEELLASLVAELDQNITLFEQSHRFFEAKSTSTLKILEIAAAEDVDSVGLEEFDKLLANLAWWNLSQLSRGSVDSLIDSGLLREVQPVELRVALAGWGKRLEFMNQIEEQDYHTYQNYLLPFFHEHTNLQQITQSMTGRPGGDAPGFVGFNLPIQSQRDHRRLLQNTKFLSLVTNIYWNEADGVQFAKNFKDEANGLKRAIQSVRK